MLVDEFQAFLRAARKSQTAQDKYVQAARAFLVYLNHETHQSLLTMKGNTLRNFVGWMMTPEPGCKVPAPATVNLMVAGVRSYLDFLIGEDVKIPPQAKPERLRLPHQMPLALSREQLDAYVQCCLVESDPMATALLIIPYCGLRVNEVCQLRVRDVLWDTVGDERRYVFHVEKGKGGKQRLAPMFTGPAGLVSKSLAVYMEQERPKYKLDSKFPPGERWLFPMPVGGMMGPINPSMLQKRIRRFRPKVGMRELHPHVGRSHWCTALLSVAHLYDPPLDSLEVAEYMGHTKNLDTMKNHYSSVRLKDAQLWMGWITRPTLEMYSRTRIRKQ